MTSSWYNSGASLLSQSFIVSREFREFVSHRTSYVKSCFCHCGEMMLLSIMFLVTIRYGGEEVSAGAAPAPAVATCTLGQTTPTDARPLDGLHIKCPQDTTLQQVGSLVPNDSGNAPILTGANGNAVPISTLLPTGMYLRTVAEGVTMNTLRVSQLPLETVGLYFECRHRNAAHTCYIQVNVLPAHRLGPNVCELLGTRLKFAVHNENEKVQFYCGTGLSLFPAKPEVVYDGNCRHELHLHDVLPGAYINYSTGKSPNVLVVVYLPSSPQSLCYICVPPGQQPTEKNNCFVRVTSVAGTSASPPLGLRSSASLALTASTASVALVLA